MQGDLSILYALMGVVIFLALLAALGAWVRGGGLKKDEAENLFSDSQEQQREELSRLEKIIEETRMTAEQSQAKTEAAIAAKLRELDEQVARTETTLQAAVSQAANDQNASLSKELELVSSRIGESESRMSSNMTDINRVLQTVQTQVSEAGDQMRTTLMEITRQQQEQKAQSTIQLCEALITSLGTLKSSISTQLEQNAAAPPQAIDADNSTVGEEPASIAGAFSDADTARDENATHEDDIDHAGYEPRSTTESYSPDVEMDQNSFENQPDAYNERAPGEGNIEVEQEPRAMSWEDITSIPENAESGQSDAEHRQDANR